jgi:hypothetical protein
MIEFDFVITKILFLITVVFLFYSLFYLSRKTETQKTTLVLLTIQLSISLLRYQQFGLIADENTYHSTGLNLMNSLDNGQGFQNYGVGPGKESFTFILGTIYYILGPYPELGLITNVYLTSLIPSILVLACNNLGLKSIGKLAAWLFVFSPPSLLWATGLRRESLAFLLVSLSVLTISFVYNRRFIPGFILFGITYYGISISRPQILLVLIPGVFLALFISPKIDFKKMFYDSKNLFSNRVMIISLTLIHFIYGYSNFIDPFIKKLPTFNGYLQEISSPRFSTSVLGASWQTNSSPFEYTYNLFRSISGPPFWEWSSISMVVFGIEGIFYFVTFILVAISIKKFNLQRREILILISCSAPLLLASTLLLGNYGINSRIRAHYLIPLIPILALFIKDIFKARRFHS